MYKVFIENRGVNFTNKVEFTNGIPFIEYKGEILLVEEILPRLKQFDESQEIIVLTNDSIFNFTRFFSEFIFVEAAGGIVEFEGEFLFIKRNGFWDIPKGKLESKETFEFAAEREIEEECGIKKLHLQELICSTFHTYFFKGKWHLKKTNWYHFQIRQYQDTTCQVEEGITESIWISKMEFDLIHKNTFSSIKFVVNEFSRLLVNNITVEQAIELLKEDKVVAIPTETVYGLAANAFSELAVSMLFSLKNRPQTNPLIVHCGSIEQVLSLTSNFPEKALLLAQRFWPGPLTLLLPKNHIIPSNITAGSNRVGVRIPNHPLTLKLLSKLNFPLAAPSANKYGSISPTCADHVRLQFGDELPLIIDGGACQVGIESTIIGFEDGKTIVYRLGQITIEEIMEVCGKDVYIKNEAGELIVAPGMVKHHYAPKTNLLLVTENSEIQRTSKTGVILFNEHKMEGIPDDNQVFLSESQNFEEASRNLYSTFYELDQMQLDRIYIKLLPDIGIGKSLNDRIRRAAMKE